jgi:hypothetical protein
MSDCEDLDDVLVDLVIENVRKTACSDPPKGPAKRRPLIGIGGYSVHRFPDLLLEGLGQLWTDLGVFIKRLNILARAARR